MEAPIGLWGREWRGKIKTIAVEEEGEFIMRWGGQSVGRATKGKRTGVTTTAERRRVWDPGTAVLPPLRTGTRLAGRLWLEEGRHIDWPDVIPLLKYVYLLKATALWFTCWPCFEMLTDIAVYCTCCCWPFCSLCKLPYRTYNYARPWEVPKGYYSQKGPKHSFCRSLTLVYLAVQ